MPRKKQHKKNTLLQTIANPDEHAKFERILQNCKREDLQQTTGKKNAGIPATNPLSREINSYFNLPPIALALLKGDCKKFSALLDKHKELGLNPFELYVSLKDCPLTNGQTIPGAKSPGVPFGILLMRFASVPIFKEVIKRFEKHELHKILYLSYGYEQSNGHRFQQKLIHIPWYTQSFGLINTTLNILSDEQILEEHQRASKLLADPRKSLAYRRLYFDLQTYLNNQIKHRKIKHTLLQNNQSTEITALKKEIANLREKNRCLEARLAMSTEETKSNKELLSALREHSEKMTDENEVLKDSVNYLSDRILEAHSSEKFDEASESKGDDDDDIPDTPLCPPYEPLYIGLYEGTMPSQKELSSAIRNISLYLVILHKELRSYFYDSADKQAESGFETLFICLHQSITDIARCFNTHDDRIIETHIERDNLVLAHQQALERLGVEIEHLKLCLESVCGRLLATTNKAKCSALLPKPEQPTSRAAGSKFALFETGRTRTHQSRAKKHLDRPRCTRNWK